MDSSVNASALEKHTVSIFGCEVTILGSGEIYIELEEGKSDSVGNQGEE